MLVIATHNLKKAGEMIAILAAGLPDVEIKTLADFPPSPEPEETGTTYAENARIKAVAAARATGKRCIADDAGLEIDALGGEPGLYSKRFAGEDTPFPEKMAIILDRMRETPESDRGARFRCAVCVAWPEGDQIAVRDFESRCEGRIAQEPSGAGGFGYDPIFLLPELGVCMADLTADQKHAISHRGKVLREVLEWFGSDFAASEPR